MDTPTLRHTPRRRRTVWMVAMGLLLVVVGTASVGSAHVDRRGGKRVEVVRKSDARAKLIARGHPSTTRSSTALSSTTAPTSAPAPTTAPPTTVTSTTVGSAPTTAASAPTTAAPRATGPTFYVATDGNDSNSGTAAAPWRSLTAAIARLKAGDTLYVRGGRYAAMNDEQFNIEGKNGNANAWITIAAYPGERPVIQLNSFWQGFYVLNSSYVEIRGLEIIGTALTDQRMTDGVEVKGSHHVRVAGNVVHDVGGCGICSIESNHVRIEGNEVYGASKWNVYQTSGISLFLSNNIGGGNNADGFSMYISGNRVHHNTNIAKPGPGQKVTDGNCIIIDVNDQSGYLGSTLIQNNLCYENGGRGVHVFRSKNVVAVNNTLVNNLRHPEIDGGELTVGFSSAVVYRNNLTSASRPGAGVVVWDGQVELDHNVHIGQAPTQLGAGDQVTAVSISPDFTLAPNSPAIDAGSTVLAPTTDIRGVRRDARPDVGAFEAT
jgi:parallel beta-helix repeat protein